jgi:hypothetical protein
MSDSRGIETLTAEDFRSNLGSSFQLIAQQPSDAPSISIDIELVEVSEHAAYPTGAFRTPFSLLFHGPLEPVMPQATYRLEHPGLGSFDLFTVPVGPDEPTTPGQPPTAMRYEIVFG